MFREGHKAAGETEQMPAEKPPPPEYSNLEDLMGYLSTTERMRKQELNEQQRNATLEQRARSEEWYLRTEEVRILEKIGQGQCAEVYKARWRGMFAVAKALKRPGDYKAGWTLATARADLVHEITVLSHLRHPNLVLFLGACIDHQNVVLLNEYMDGGNVEEYVCALTRRHPGARARVTRKQCARWGIDLAQAITFLHGCSPQVIHRDLKPANLLLCSNGVLKVGDFGLSSARHQQVSVGGETYVMTGCTGTIRYMAPEAMLIDEDGNSSYNEKVDCYSAAMVMWFICMADKPFGDIDAELIMVGAKSGLRPDLSSIERRHGKHLADTIKSCWEADATRRSSAEELLDKMREQLSIIEKKKADRRKLMTLPIKTISRWASSAASRIFGTGKERYPEGDDERSKGQRFDSKSPPALLPPAHHPATSRITESLFRGPSSEAEAEFGTQAVGWHRPLTASALASLDKATGSSESKLLDNTNTTTGSWSLDASTNAGNSLDNTANTVKSRKSNEDDWFSQVADERRGASASATVLQRGRSARSLNGSEGSPQSGQSQTHTPEETRAHSRRNTPPSLASDEAIAIPQVAGV